MGLLQIISTNWNGSVHSCMVHSLQIMQIYWAALEKDEFSELKNVTPGIVIATSMSSSGLMVQKGREETGEV